MYENAPTATPENTPPTVVIPFDNTYARLPDHFYARVEPARVSRPELMAFNAPLARELGVAIDGDRDAIAAVFAGNRLPERAEPLAMAYAGHQFGQFVPQLGDGRALLLGEVIDASGRRRDIQLKGSGQTPYSRRGDGRAAVGPVLREYLIGEAMHALGIPTTRALAAVATGEPVYRESVLPGAVLTRVASSHVRVGTFQYFAARGNTQAVRQLADYVIDRHYSEVRHADCAYLALLDAIVDRQAYLVSRWLGVGFIHGVMNTDNTSIAGETIDFGPCAFMDTYDPATVFSSIDHYGRYAYANQPPIAQWNLARLAETMLPLIDPDIDRAIERATASVNAFAERYDAHWLDEMRRKLGLMTAEDGDRELIDDLLKTMHANHADWTLTFRGLTASVTEASASGAPRGLFDTPDAFDAWATRWRTRLEREASESVPRAVAMRQANPVYIPRNHQVEEALEQAVRHGNLEPWQRLLAVLSRPYEEQPGAEAYAEAPPPGERDYQTFCGT